MTGFEAVYILCIQTDDDIIDKWMSVQICDYTVNSWAGAANLIGRANPPSNNVTVSTWGPYRITNTSNPYYSATGKRYVFQFNMGQYSQ